MPSFAPAYQLSRIEQVAQLRDRYGLPDNPGDIPAWTDFPMGPGTVNGGFHVKDGTLTLAKLIVGYEDALGITAIQDELLGIASDNLLTPNEKPMVIRDRDVILAEQAGIDAQATAFAVSHTAYDAAVTALNGYLFTLGSPVSWNDLTGDTTIVGTVFRSKFADVYTTRQTLLDGIYAAAKVLANNAQGGADTALADLTNIASDSVLSRGEKPVAVADYNAIIAEQAGIDAQATAFGVSHIGYDAAVTALTAYLATLLTPTLWSNFAGDTNMFGDTFRSKFSDVYIARRGVLNGIYAAAKALADGANNNANTRIKPHPGGGVQVDGNMYITSIDMDAGISIRSSAGASRTQITADGMAVYLGGVVKVQIDHTNGISIRNTTASPEPGLAERLSFLNYAATEVGWIGADEGTGWWLTNPVGAVFLQAATTVGVAASSMGVYASLTVGQVSYPKDLVVNGSAGVTGAMYVGGVVGVDGAACIHSGSGAPAAGLGSTGDLYLGTGGSFYFKQLAGWRRIDNWVT